MLRSSQHKIGIATFLAFAMACAPASALVSIDDGKNQFFVNANVSYTWDSNVFANNTSGGDSIVAASVGIDFRRNAGMIGVNGSAFMDASSFITNSGENSVNPRFELELTKQSGRTTGALTVAVSRQSKADALVNVRNESWNYNTGLNLKYPVIERYTLAGAIGFGYLDYLDNRLFVDLKTYTASVDLFYVYNTERDLIAGYRVRYGETSANSSYYDHAFTVGVSGKILPKVGGTLRAGYQFHEPAKGIGESFTAITASGQAKWTITKKISAALQLSKDFTTTSTNTTVDATSANCDFQYGMNSKTSLFAGTGYGINDFLGIPGANRKDYYFTWSVGAHYTFSSYLKLALNYTYFQNWSNVSFSDFTRNSINLTATSTF